MNDEWFEQLMMKAVKKGLDFKARVISQGLTGLTDEFAGREFSVGLSFDGREIGNNRVIFYPAPYGRSHYGLN